ncbi:MAG: class I SAM-dependent methyltransferase [Planctomycetes bacterium]|nr:class I SAM-dependent methyltransferase [Planctomycetota bacterium]
MTPLLAPLLNWEQFSSLSSTRQRAKYFLQSACKLAWGRQLNCPSCGESRSHVVDRKWLVTTLRRCDSCRLLYRAPTTSAAEYERFYQRQYGQGFTTDLPDDATLERLKRSHFRDSPKDYQHYLNVLTALGGRPGQRLFDFGCSWGYGSWQLSQAGYQVDACEISVPRGHFARDRLGVRVMSVTEIAPGSYDLFFSSHVIEHVPSVAKMLALGLRALRPGGLFVAFTPNGSTPFRQRFPALFHHVWGFVHPQLIDGEFAQHLALKYTVLTDSSPYSLDNIACCAWQGHQAVKLDGHELLLVVRKDD